MYRACIFDLDGTLCDSVESIAYCANHAIRDLGMKEASLEDYKIFVGDGVDMLVRRLLRFNGEESDRQFDVLKEKYMGYFLGKRYQKLPMWLVWCCTMNRTYWEKIKVLDKKVKPDRRNSAKKKAGK